MSVSPKKDIYFFSHILIYTLTIVIRVCVCVPVMILIYFLARIILLRHINPRHTHRLPNKHTIRPHFTYIFSISSYEIVRINVFFLLHVLHVRMNIWDEKKFEYDWKWWIVAFIYSFIGNLILHSTSTLWEQVKKNIFFRQNVKSTMHALKTFFIKTLFLYCHPCLSTGSKEICMGGRVRA